jgi:catechol 2,3-dioxygenase-like lactoylglutathione lyase family enzyme
MIAHDFNRGDDMARLRHFAIVVRDLDKAARFYETVFELKRVGRDDLEFASAVYLSDGVVNLALLNYRGERGSGLKDAKNFVGAHHFGFQVEDIATTQKRIEAAGGQFFFDLGDDQDKENFERKFKDPDGIIFDISRKGWLGATG